MPSPLIIGRSKICPDALLIEILLLAHQNPGKVPILRLGPSIVVLHYSDAVFLRRKYE